MRRNMMGAFLAVAVIVMAVVAYLAQGKMLALKSPDMAAYEDPGIPVELGNSVLEAFLADSIGLSGDLTKASLESIRELDLSYTELTSLRGIEYMTQLERLSLRGTRVADMHTLGTLTSLIELDLRDTAISNIEFLRGLENLQVLNIRSNTVIDLSPLASLVRLVELNVRDNLVVDIGPLQQLINLVDVNLRHNNITDISALAGLPNLRRRLYLQGNPIECMSPVADIYHLVADVDFDLAAVTASHPGGLYSSAVEVTLSSFNENVTIYYTLDGSVPDTGTLTYDGPIMIRDRTGEAPEISLIQTSEFKWTDPGGVSLVSVLRARAYLEGEPVGDEVVRTYLVKEDIFDRYKDLPIISLVTDPANLFSEGSGIYVPGDLWTGASDSPWAPANYTARGDDWERVAYMEFYESDGTLAFAQSVGLRIHGGLTRSLPQKSLRIYARSDYGKAAISYPVFSDPMISEYKRLLLRNSGDDWEFSMLRDGLIQSLFTDTHVDTQAFRPAVVFINGEFWGLHNIRERLDKYYIAAHYGVDPDNLDLLERTDYQMYADQGDTVHYELMLEFLRANDMSLTQNYEYIRTQMDVHSFIDFLIAHIYSSNVDSMTNNIKYWRSREEAGLWRWQLFDLDWGFFWQEHDTLKWATGIIADMPEATLIFRSLLQNDEFRHKFINRYADLLNTRLLPLEVTGRIISMAADIAAVMPEHQERWGRPESMEYWEWIIEEMTLFAEERPQFAREHIMTLFEIPYTVEIDVLVEGQGALHLNSLVLEDNWVGVYFAGVPISLTIVPTVTSSAQTLLVNGVLVNGETITIVPSENTTVEVVFVNYAIGTVDGGHIPTMTKPQVVLFHKDAGQQPISVLCLQ